MVFRALRAVFGGLAQVVVHEKKCVKGILRGVQGGVAG